MKVEFKDTQFGSSLCVKTSEFIKSKDGGSEMTSIRRAIRAFYHLYCIDIGFRSDIMDDMLIAIYRQAIKNNGIIIFTCEGDRLKDSQLNIYLMSNGGVMKIIYEN